MTPLRSALPSGWISAYGGMTKRQNPATRYLCAALIILAPVRHCSDAVKHRSRRAVQWSTSASHHKDGAVAVLLQDHAQRLAQLNAVPATARRDLQIIMTTSGLTMRLRTLMRTQTTAR